MGFNVLEENKSLPSLFLWEKYPFKHVRKFEYLGHMENNTSWELTANELRKLESIWYSFLWKMLCKGYMRENVPPTVYLKIKKEVKKLELLYQNLKN